MGCLSKHFSYYAPSGVSTEYEDKTRACGGIQRGACAPLCVVAGVGYIGEGPHRKGPSPMRLFGDFLSAYKKSPGAWGWKPYKAS